MPEVRPEIKRLQDDAIRAVGSKTDEIAARCNARIDVLFMDATQVRPREPFFSTTIELQFFDKGGKPIVQKWYVPFLLRDLSFSYDPRKIARIWTARPRPLPAGLSPKKQGS